jgi:hypothetical protein
LTGYSSPGALTWWGTGEYATLEKSFIIVFSNKKESNSPNYFHIFFLIALLKKDLIKNIRSLQSINYDMHE